MLVMEARFKSRQLQRVVAPFLDQLGLWWLG